MVANSLVQQQSGKKTFSTFMTSDAVKNKINQMIAGKDGGKFITSVISLVSNNPELAKCEHATILSAALLGESLKLSPSPQLGQYYLVPFNDNKNNRMVAQFQLGYKGYIQLAMRSGNYADIDVIEVREGEYKGKDKTTGKPKFEFIEDDDLRETLPIIGYYAYFELLNGFKKSLYWTEKKMQDHAQRYSQGYRSDLKKGNKYSYWSKDFIGMAFKTVLKQLLSKWGILSVEFITAIANDMAFKEDINDQPQYVDNVDDNEIIEVKLEQPEPEEDDDPFNNLGE